MKKLFPDPHSPNNAIASGGIKLWAAMTLAKALTSLEMLR
jgi:hypothetical protein